MNALTDTGDEMCNSTPLTPEAAGMISIVIPEAKEEPAEVRRELKVVDAGLVADDPIPPRQWLLGNVFCRGYISSLQAEGAGGKTVLRIAQALSLATGRSLTGEHVFLRCRVLFVVLEDGMSELRRRVRAAMMHHDIDAEEIREHLYLTTPTREDGKLMETDAKRHIVRGALADELERIIKARKIDLLIIDPLIKTHDLDENSNPQMDALMQLLSNMADEHEIAVDVLHHVSKGAADPGNASRGRGASAIKDAGRLVYTLSRMSEDEARNFDIEEASRRYFVRVDGAKINLAKPADKAQWFKLIGVPLGNATETYPGGDCVQTVEVWSPPDAWEGLGTAKLKHFAFNMGHILQL